MFDNIKKASENKVVQLTDADIIPADISIDFMKEKYADYVEDTEKQLQSNEVMYEEIVDIINEYRFKKNRKGLEIDNDLMQLAQIRAEEIAKSNKMSHTRPDGTYFSSLFQEYGWSKGQVGENIAWGYKTAEEVCGQWKISETHYNNLTAEKWTKTGIGIAQYKDGTYVFVQEFAGDNVGTSS